MQDLMHESTRSHAPGRLVARAIDWLARQRRRRAGIRALTGLDDRLLRDVGIERRLIEPLVDGALERTPSRRARPVLKLVSIRRWMPARDQAAPAREAA